MAFRLEDFLRDAPLRDALNSGQDFLSAAADHWNWESRPPCKNKAIRYFPSFVEEDDVTQVIEFDDITELLSLEWVERLKNTFKGQWEILLIGSPWWREDAGFTPTCYLVLQADHPEQIPISWPKMLIAASLLYPIAGLKVNT